MATAEFNHQVEVCRAWLKDREKTKHLNPRAGSTYGLKHKVENDMGRYVSNDAFKEAARLEGFRVDMKYEFPYINIRTWREGFTEVLTPLKYTKKGESK